MEDFNTLGFGWVMTDSFMQFKRPLVLSDTAIVSTWVEDFNKNIVEVHFTINKKENKKLACNGWFRYSMVNLKSLKAAHIPEEIAAKYSI
jgi:acyl-CoA thioester hydrolase/thioesterase-3